MQRRLQRRGGETALATGLARVQHQSQLLRVGETICVQDLNNPLTITHSQRVRGSSPWRLTQDRFPRFRREIGLLGACLPTAHASPQPTTQLRQNGGRCPAHRWPMPGSCRTYRPRARRLTMGRGRGTPNRTTRATRMRDQRLEDIAQLHQEALEADQKSPKTCRHYAWGSAGCHPRSDRPPWSCADTGRLARSRLQRRRYRRIAARERTGQWRRSTVCSTEVPAAAANTALRLPRTRCTIPQMRAA
jgi:hypothetical protein